MSRESASWGVNRISRLPLFETAILLSLTVHFGIWCAFAWKKYKSQTDSPPSIEIDLTRPFRLTNNPLLARRAVNSGTGAPVVTSPVPLPPETASAEKPAPLQEWILPGPDTRELVKPASAEDPSSPTGLGGWGDGTGSGEVDWVYLTGLPKMLNRDELLRSLRRYYPEQERLAGREGQVWLDVHIDKSGNVSAVEVVTSAGQLFDDAAKKVIRAARFSPARVGENSVAVKIRQPISFQLEE